MQLIKIFLKWNYKEPLFLEKIRKFKALYYLLKRFTWIGQYLAFLLIQGITFFLIFISYYLIFWPFGFIFRNRNSIYLRLKIRKDISSYFEKNETSEINNFDKMF